MEIFTRLLKTEIHRAQERVAKGTKIVVTIVGWCRIDCNDTVEVCLC